MPLVVMLVALATGQGELPVFDDLKPAVSSCCASRTALRDTLLSASPEFGACWETHGAGHPSIMVSLQALISLEGQTVEAYAKGPIPELNACVVDALFELEWQPVRCPSRVLYPLRFEPADD